MNVSYRIEKNILYIALNGRIDASNAENVENIIFEILKNNKQEHLILDADLLSYISSAGLRILLKLKKIEPEIAIINVASDVYDVFDMTGFTEMLTIKKAYKKLSIEGCEYLAKGANGVVYRYNDETILKVYHGKDTLPDIQQERANARKAFVLGINTAIPYGIVKVGEEYGTITELLNAVSLSKLIKENQNDLEKYVDYFASMVKNIHSIKITDNDLPKNKTKLISWFEFVKHKFNEKEIEKLEQLIDTIPESNTLLHGDYHTNNIMIQNDEAVLIDMDTLSIGHPVLELGYMHNALAGYSLVNRENVLDFLGYPLETAKKVWKMTLEKYFETTDQEYLSNVEKKAQLVGYIRALRHAIRQPENQFKERLIVAIKEEISRLLLSVDTLDF